ncbi:MAG TPA: 50S ribosomal protein L15 [Rhizobiales bacterium]|nr:50S ribosomal protein L15 [bacterium BMS3Bbin10]HDO51885.1 50S ribosomal protein L15 [Hyphomicrobiales bacterium]
MRLNELRDNPGATRSRKRVGRGPGSGKGKTAGRGYNGQKSRSGVAIKGFEGGQMPIHRRLPKRGFNNLFAKDFNEVNVGRLQAAIDKKTLDPKKSVTVDALLAAGIIRRARDGVRLLGQGDLKTKLSLEVTGASAGAVKAVEKVGGTVSIVEMPKRAAKPKSLKSKDKTETTAKKSDEAGEKEAKAPSAGAKPAAKSSGKSSAKSPSGTVKKDSS